MGDDVRLKCREIDHKADRKLCLDLSHPGAQPVTEIDDVLSRYHADRQHRRGLVVHRSEEHTSELQSLMRISYAVFCLKTKNTKTNIAKMIKSTSHIKHNK